MFLLNISKGLMFLDLGLLHVLLKYGGFFRTKTVVTLYERQPCSLLLLLTY